MPGRGKVLVAKLHPGWHGVEPILAHVSPCSQGSRQLSLCSDALPTVTTGLDQMMFMG